MLKQFHTIAVVGAGTMGIGIAEVAASKNQKVKLYDLDADFAHLAKESMAKRLYSRVERGKINANLCQQIIANIEIVTDLQALSDSQLVIEAIVENLEVKKKLFKQLEKICGNNTLLSSNTSSISITAIASALMNPEKMIGLHFFNPAPVMQLVEVVAGLRSSKESLKKGVELCEFWHKTPVLAQSSPGFIVNRVARPFYGEALKMLQEKVASAEIIDALMTSAGFRMGPFKLMDLIGMDINLAVSQTVFKSMYFDPRYKPSLIQQEMVSANLLGKKTGQGFYSYNGTGDSQVTFENQRKYGGFVDRISIIKNLRNNVNFEIDNCLIVLANGQTCKQRIESSGYQHVCHVDLSLDYESCKIVHICFDANCPESSKEKVITLFQMHNKEVIVSKDLPAQIVMRIVCMLINEAADAIENGVCSEYDVDLAMQKGVNYPIGLIEWARNIGIEHVVSVLENLHHWFGDDRYRVSPWLRMQLP